MIYQTNRWWILDYEDKYQELWVKEHNKQTPMWRRQEIFKRTLSDGYHEVNGVKIPCTKLRELTAEEQDELNKIAQEQREYANGRDRYIAQRVFDEIGYDEFLIEAERSGHKEWIYEHTFAPCLSADAQCCIDCPIWSYCHEY